MKKILKYIIVSLVICSSLGLSANEKAIYTSKNNKTGIIGDYDKLCAVGFGPRIFHNDISMKFKWPAPGTEWDLKKFEDQLNEEKIGKKLLNYFFLKNNYEFDENLKLLSDRVGKNLSQKDIQSKEAELAITEGISNWEIMEILSNNYVFLTKEFEQVDQKGNKKKAYHWAAYHVDITEKTLEEVYNAWDYSSSILNNPVYDKIDVKVSYVNSGANTYGYDFDELSEKIPGLAIRGVLIQRNPCITSLGTVDGAEDNDRVDVYRQYSDKDGNLYSKKISSARICDISADKSRVYFISGSKGSAQYGDQVVLNDDAGGGFIISGNYAPGNAGFSFTTEMLAGTSKVGIESILNLDLGCNFALDRSTQIVNDLEYKAPIIVNWGLGMGFRYTFVGRLSMMPYLKIQGDAAFFPEKKPENAPSSYESDIKVDSYFRTPLGLRFDINICYPVQLTLGAEYAFIFNLFDFKKVSDKLDLPSKEDYETFDYLKGMYDKLGLKRDGLNLYAGLRFAF